MKVVWEQVQNSLMRSASFKARYNTVGTSQADFMELKEEWDGSWWYADYSGRHSSWTLISATTLEEAKQMALFIHNADL